MRSASTSTRRGRARCPRASTSCSSREFWTRGASVPEEPSEIAAFADSSVSAASRRSRSFRTGIFSTFHKRSRGRSWRDSARGEDGGCSMSSNGNIKFLTHEVGSLAKPPWLVKTSAGKPLEESDVEHAQAWGEKLECRRARAARRAPAAGRARPGRDRALVEPLLPPPPGVGGRRRRLGR